MNRSSWFDVAGYSGLRVVWEDGDRVFCRGWRDGAEDRNTVLVVLPAAEHPTSDSLNRLTHEYGLKDDLDDAWAARPVALTHYNDRAISTSKPRWAKRPEAITSAQSWQVEKRGGPR